jgi:VCBS repeat protein/FG-GAP repeat protein
VSLISDRRPSRAAAFALISLAACISTLANPFAARVYAQTPAATARNEIREASAPASPGSASPSAPRWLKDDRQREYFVDRIPKNRAVRINQNTVRNFWGFPLDVVREDGNFYYYKSYKPIVAPATAPAPRVAADEKRNILRSYRAKTLTSDRLRFSAFGKGLPSSGQWREGFAIADMNGDGHPDLVLAPARKTAQPLPVIFLGDGKGSWSRWRQTSFPNLPYDYGDVQVGDFNHDGHPDIALGVHLRGLIALVGDGKGGFTEAGQGLDFAVGGASPFSSTALRIVDWNGPGSQDILAFGEGPALALGRKIHYPRGAVLYSNLGNGKWSRREFAGNSQLFGESITVGDFAGDGHPGFATSTSVMNRRDLVTLWQPGGQSKSVTIDELRPMAYVWSVAAADFDGDGRADLAVAYTSFELSTWHTGIDILYSRGGGHWVRQVIFAEESRDGPVALATGDLEGRGHKDLVALTGDGRTLVFLGDGHGSFSREKHPPPVFNGSCRGAHVELANLDGGKTDEIVAAFSDEHDSHGHCPSDGGIVAWKPHSSAARLNQ